MEALASGFQNAFGNLVPWGDPAWYRAYNSPFYGDTHRAWRAKCRAFVEKEVMPNVHDWDEAKHIPKEFYIKAAKAGILAGCVGEWPTEFVGEGPEDWDVFHGAILTDELSRCGSGGFVWGLVGGLGIGLPPVMHFGSDFLKKKVVPGCLSGEKFICLAITEPYAGSDVAAIRTTAVKDPTGKFYIVNGEKKWITNGVFADFFTVAVRTGGPGADGISLLLVERGPGIRTKQMDCMGVWSSGTTYITFEDVMVPVENLIGKENSGFKYIMHNFNQERMGIVYQALRFSRVCLEESFLWAHSRQTFGKRLIDHPVIRAKLAEMARQVEATQAMTEILTYQMKTIPREQAMMLLGGDTALLKVQATKTFEFCAREAAQIFGGASYVRGGKGEKIERLYREVRAYAIPGGSEEIMMDLSVRQAAKQWELTQKILKKMKSGRTRKPAAADEMVQAKM